SDPSVLLYLPVPLLIWAALRFGPALASAAYAMVVVAVAVSAAAQPLPLPLPIQPYLIGMGVPLLLLAAVMEERRTVERKLRASEHLFAVAFDEGPDAMAISRSKDGAVLHANRRWQQLLGEHSGSAKSSPLLSRLDEAGRAQLKALAANPQQRRELE